MINFFIGQYVETVDGDVGYIDYICHCDRCKERGFFEPYVLYKDGSTDFITKCDYDSGLKRFRQIGNVTIIESTDIKSYI